MVLRWGWVWFPWSFYDQNKLDEKKIFMKCIEALEICFTNLFSSFKPFAESHFELVKAGSAGPPGLHSLAERIVSL